VPSQLRIRKHEHRVPPVCVHSFREIIIVCYAAHVMRFVSDIIIICSVLTHSGRGTTDCCCSSVPGRMGRVVLLMRFSSFAHRNRFAVCPLFARLKPSAPEVNPDNMSKAADGFLCAVNIYNIVCLSTSSFKINRLTVKRARSLCRFLLKIMKKTTKCCCDPVF